MTETNTKVLELLKQNKSMKEICRILNITEKQLFIRIKQIINSGYQIERTYNYDSDMHYNILCGIQSEKYNPTISIPKKEKDFKCIVISDLHIGNIDSDIDLLKGVYEYASKNDINYILNCGDLIEGDYTSDRKSISSVEDQVEFLIKKHPYDKNINNMVIFGNHDYHALKKDGFSILERLNNSRYDIIPLGYGQGNINLKNDTIVMFHKINEASCPTLSGDEKIILSGHGHLMKTKIKNQLWLCIPSLSYVSVDKTKDTIPGFVEMRLYFEKGLIEYVEAKHIILSPKIVTISESRCRVKSLEMYKGN